MKQILRDKRGISPDIFAWLFGLIVGAIIFVFILRFGYQHIDISESLDDRQRVEFLNDQLEAMSGVDSSSNILDFNQDASFFFSCETLGSGDYGKEFQKIIFAPTRLDGETMSVWTEQWEFPFPIAHLYYLSNEKHKVVIVYDALTEELVRSLDIPEIFSVQMVQSSALTPSNLDQLGVGVEAIHLVFFSPMDYASFLNYPSRVPVHVVVVDPATRSVQYLNRNQRSFYAGDALLLGAIFAPEQYGCVLPLALTRLEKLANIYSQKAALLMRKTDSEVCRGRLFELSRTLSTFATLRDPDQLYRYHDMILSQERALEGYDCPKVMT